MSRPGTTSAEHPPDLSQRWQHHLRQKARTTVTLACPYCTDNRIFFEEPKLFDHVRKDHSKYIPSSNEEEFWQELRERSERKEKFPGSYSATSHLSSKAVPKPPSKAKRPVSASTIISTGLQHSNTDCPVSASTITSTGPLVAKEIPGFKDLSIESSQKPPRSDRVPDSARLSPIQGTRKRAANAEPAPFEASPDFRSATDAINPRRAKARSGSGFYNLAQPNSDPEFDRKAQASTGAEPARAQLNQRRTLFDPATDPLALSVRKDSHSPASHIHDSRAHVFRSKVPQRRRGPKPMEHEMWQPGFQTSMQTALANRKHTQMPEFQKDLPTSLLMRSDEIRTLQQIKPSGLYFVGSDMERDPELVMQPETRPISQEQLVAEVKGIYAGLVMVEAKCVEVDNKQIDTLQGSPQLSNEQFQALIALHRTLLHEHHDFFLASQHPSASPALRRLASKYAMPARMWRHGIHSFLELLRHRLPASLDHMLAFIYLAYSMVALLFETVPTFEDTWIECLGDLGRYRMAIEDDDIRDREVWTGVARFWYSNAADKSPETGRLYHHLAILARPYALQQLFYYTKSLSVNQPFHSARESIMTLFEPFLGSDQSYGRSQPVDAAFVRVHGMLFTKSRLDTISVEIEQFLNLLDSHIARVTAKWMEQGVFIAVTNIAAMLGFGSEDSVLQQALDTTRKCTDPSSDPGLSHSSGADTTSTGPQPQEEPDELLLPAPASANAESTQTPQFETHLEKTAETVKCSALSQVAFVDANRITFATLDIASRRIGDRNILPHIHVSLVFIYYVRSCKAATQLLSPSIPWKSLAILFNSLLPIYKTPKRMQDISFPVPEKGVGRPLREEFMIRGLDWTTNYFPKGWFSNAKLDDEERSLEHNSMFADRIERILWLACQISKASVGLFFHSELQLFSASEVSDDDHTEEHRSNIGIDTEMSGMKQDLKEFMEPSVKSPWSVAPLQPQKDPNTQIGSDEPNMPTAKEKASPL